MSSNNRTSPSPTDMSRRRGSVTQAALSTMFQRSSSISGPSGSGFGPVPTMPSGESRRRMSVSTGVGIGLTGTSPTGTYLRRASVSTNASEGMDECAIEDDESPSRRPLQRRMSYSTGPSRSRAIPPSPNTNDQGFNWSEQLRSRAESFAMASRPTWASSSPPRGVAPAAHERSKPISEMAQPPAQAATMRPPQRPPPRKPDAFQERILKGDFYMD